MPFTGSHPAAVLPLLRTGLPASALVAGSTAPDLPFYLPVDLGVPTHTALAVVTTDVLLGGALWALWHGLLSRPALAWAPGSVTARLPAAAAPGLGRRLRTPAQGVRLVTALAAGAATHVLWDEFTHPGRWGAENVPALSATWAGEAGYSWAQDLSGVVGALVLAGWLARWWRRTPAAPSAGSRPGWWLPWTALAGTAAVAGAVAATGAPDVRSGAVAAAFAGGGAALGTAVLLALAETVRAGTRQRVTPPRGPLPGRRGRRRPAAPPP